jgi:hypothetical protein
MNFNAKRLALLAGVGDPNDRHDIVQEQVQQLNESAEARQLNEDEEEVRKAVRRTIQKMISEGAITLQEDSIARELEHLRANIKADHDHIEALVHDMRDDRDEIERAEHHRDQMHEDEKTDDSKKPGTGSSPRPDDGPSDADLKVVQKLFKKLGPVDLKDILKKHNVPALEESEEVEETLSEADATLTRLQMLAGVQILSEGYTDDELRELCHSKDHNCAVVVEHPDWGRGKPIYESHALPDDEGNVEWYDVQFKHGIERKVMAEDMTILQMEGHGKTSDMSEEDVEEAHCTEDEERMEEAEVDGVKPDDLDAPPRNDSVREEEAHDEANLYELEDGRMVLKMGGRTYMMQEMEEELNELEEELVTKVVDTETGKEYHPSK